MYIIINGVRYGDVKRTQTAQRITYISSELTEGLTVEGSIAEYRNDDFLLREVDADDYARQISAPGVLIITNEPETPPMVEPTAEELFDVLLGDDEI